MCFVEGIERSDVSPGIAVAVRRTRHVVTNEVVDSRVVEVHEVGDDVATHVVVRLAVFCVPRDGFNEGVGSKHIVPHRGKHRVRIIRQALGLLGLFNELRNASGIFGIDFDHAELIGLLDGLPDRCHRARATRFDVGLNHLREIHPVDVVCTNHHDVVGLGVTNDVEVLIDRIGAPEIPVLTHALLSRHGGDVIAEQ